RLDRDRDVIRRDFLGEKSIPTHFCAVDDLLPVELAERIAAVFSETGGVRLMGSFWVKKVNLKSLDKFDPLIADVTFAFQDPKVVELVSEITDIKDAVGDPHLYAGGISAMTEGHFLNPHIDNSHDGDQRNYRVLNLLYYVTPDWQAENGGNLELW